MNALASVLRNSFFFGFMLYWIQRLKRILYKHLLLCMIWKYCDDQVLQTYTPELYMIYIGSFV